MQKKTKTPQNKLQTNAKYLEKLDRITCRIRADGSDGLTKDQIRAAAEREGLSVNAFIIYAIRDKL